MALRTHVFSLGEFYHLYSRGVDKRPIFLDASDEKRFMRLLYVCNGSKPCEFRKIKDAPLLSIERGEPLVAIGAYCLMGNHFHLLVKEVREGGISSFMKKLLTGYSTYFNIKYGRTGSLFGSRFRSEYLDSDEYLKYVFSYIHLNPMKKLDTGWREKAIDMERADRFLSGYASSSYADYRFEEDREASCILSKLAFPAYFPTTGTFLGEIQNWLSYPQLTEDRPPLNGDNRR